MDTITQFYNTIKCDDFNGVLDLIESGANIHIHDDFPIMLASNLGYLDIVKLLIIYGADIHTYEDKPLRMASKCNHTDVVRFLIESGADIHADNDASIKMASMNNHLDIIKILIKHGADITYINKQQLEYITDVQFIMTTNYAILQNINKIYPELCIMHKINYIKYQMNIIYKHLLECYYRPDGIGYYQAKEHFEKMLKN